MDDLVVGWRHGLADRHAPGPERRRSVEEMTRTEVRESLAEAIAKLPDREKTVITLYYYEELTLREIGDVLGVTESPRLAAPHQGHPSLEGEVPRQPRARRPSGFGRTVR